MKKSILIVICAVLCLSLVVSAYSVFSTAKSDVTVVSTPAQASAVTPSRFVVSTVEVKRPTGKNLALKQKVSANGVTEVYTPERAVDGKTTETSYWEGKPEMPNNFTVTLDQAQDVGVVLVALNPDPVWTKRSQTFSILVSEDGTKFTEEVASKEYSFDPKTGNYVMIPLSKVKKIKGVQLVFSANTGSKGAQMAELELYTNSN